MASQRVILYSTTAHVWEVWQMGRPLARSHRHEPLTARYPDAIPPSEDQLRLEREDEERR